MQQVERQREQSKSGASSDTLLILGMFAFGLVCTAIVLLVLTRMLMDLPALLSTAVAFSAIVFFVVCGVALMSRKDTNYAARHPPTLVFRKPRGGQN